MASQFLLMKDRRFLPLFITQFLGAFNDNLMKAFIVVMVAYSVWDVGGVDPAILVSLAAALFILPFVLFCAVAGEITDKYDKAKVIRMTKIGELAIVFLAVITIYTQSTILGFIILFALGTQSAFFSPGKFSILPQHLKKDELIGANGLLSTGTYLAILGGSILGTVLALKPFASELISFFLILCALSGYIASRYILSAPPDNPDKQLNYNPLNAMVSILSYAYKRPEGVFIAILGVSWFYFVAAGIHAQFPNFSKQTLGVNTDVLSFFMIIFSLGIAFGGLLNNVILKGVISARFVPYAAFAITVFAFDLYWNAGNFKMSNGLHSDELLGFAAFFQNPYARRVLADLFLLSFAGGLYVVPLRAIIQSRTPKDHTARVVAANSLTDALFMLSSSILATILLSMGFEVRDLFALLSILTALAAFLLLRYKKF